MADAVYGPDWAGYHRATLHREPRPLLRAACDILGPGEARTAIDLGCGSGDDTLALLTGGWSVVAIDSQSTGLDLLRGRVPAGSARRLSIVRASFADVTLPPAHLIHAGYSLPFCAPGDFRGVWAGIRRALAPAGIFAGQLFGLRDSWATNAGMSFHSLEQVKSLLDNLEVLRLDETERDGMAYSGPDGLGVAGDAGASPDCGLHAGGDGD
jgi:SAM-dependent methyltransferase